MGEHQNPGRQPPVEVTFKMRIRVSRRQPSKWGWSDEMGAGGGVCREKNNQMSWSWL